MRATAIAALTAALLVVAWQQGAEAGHIFSTDITINGTPVASGNTFTDPLITVAAGDPITFSFDLFGSSGPFSVNFFKDGGTLSAPAGAVFAYDGSGTQANPVVFTFTRTKTAGAFDGYFIPNFSSSNPDYLFPGGSQADAPNIPFRLEVTPAASTVVPEPSSLALLGTGLVSLAGFGWRRRRRSQENPAEC